MSVRPARPEDLEAILAIERASPEAPHWSEATYQSLLVESAPTPIRRKILVWGGPKGISGFCVGAVTLNEGEIESIAVFPGEHRTGIGRALCQTLLAWFKEMHLASVNLEVRSTSLAPITFYKSLGFQPTTVRRAYYSNPTDDALLMALKWSDHNPAK